MFALPFRHSRRIVQASALYDLVVTAPLATPWTFAQMHDALSAANGLLGGAPLAAFAPLQMMMVNMLGSVVIVWSLVRLRDPSIAMGRWDGAARFAFALWMAYAYALLSAPILLAFLVPEIAWGIAQWWPVARARTNGVVSLPTAALPLEARA
jgi:hypothetical protein